MKTRIYAAPAVNWLTVVISPEAISRKQIVPVMSKARLSGVIHRDWNLSGELFTLSMALQHSLHTAHISSSTRATSRMESTSPRQILSSPSSREGSSWKGSPRPATDILTVSLCPQPIANGLQVESKYCLICLLSFSKCSSASIITE